MDLFLVLVNQLIRYDEIQVTNFQDHVWYNFQDSKFKIISFARKQFITTFEILNVGYGPN